MIFYFSKEATSSCTQWCYVILLFSVTHLSNAIIAVIIAASFLALLVFCCWITSMIDCCQHLRKYWCFSCCPKKPSPTTTVTGASYTTVIANQTADPSTTLVTDHIPPSYSSVFCNGISSMQETSFSTQDKKTDACVQVNLLDPVASTSSAKWLW